MKEQLYTTHEVANIAQVHRDTLLRWLREKRIPEPPRNRNGWRLFTKEQATHVVKYAKGAHKADFSQNYGPTKAQQLAVSKLKGLDWDFIEASTNYLTHSLHPYPAKYIPQIPNTLIQELSSVGETVCDPFCGSGTTLVEALLLKRNAIGLDANPLACLIAGAKSTRLATSDIEELRLLESKVAELLQMQQDDTLSLFPEFSHRLPQSPRPTFDGLEFWFEDHIIEELRLLKGLCYTVNSDIARQVALVSFSSIIVAVSKQDSDTRYVRRDKQIQKGETISKFSRALSAAITKISDFTEIVDSRYVSRVVNANALDPPSLGNVDLVVCSPPYPNAYSYHLYHRTRMLWLDMDQPSFKRLEIGSHRKYSARGSNGADANTFKRELGIVLSWLRQCLKPNRYACFVIGDSIVRSEIVQNDQILIETARGLGFKMEANISRNLQDSKKSFNPTIGKIKQEHIVIMRNARV